MIKTVKTVKDLVDHLCLFPPEAKIRFLGEKYPVEVLAIYSDSCSFRDGLPIDTEGSKFVYVDLGIKPASKPKPRAKKKPASKRKPRAKKKTNSKAKAPAKKED